MTDTATRTTADADTDTGAEPEATSVSTEPLVIAAPPAPVPAPRRRVVPLLLGGLALSALAYAAWFVGEPLVQAELDRRDRAAELERTALVDRVVRAEERVAEVELQLAETDGAIDDLQAEQTAAVSETRVELDALVTAVEALDIADADTAAALEDLRSSVEALVAAEADAVATAATRLATLELRVLLAQARLHLYEADYGRASTAMTTAAGIADDAGLGDLAERLRTASGTVVERPVAAAGELDVVLATLAESSVAGDTDARAEPNTGGTGGIEP